MADETNNAGFLSRWSRRKQQSGAAETSVVTEKEALPLTADELAPVADETSLPSVVESEQAAPAAIRSEETRVVLTDDDMPSVDSLNAESDYSPFLSEGVSKELRNLALKKLFFSGKFGIRDGLDDYDDDFTRFEPLGNTVTSDMKFHERRKERERLAKLEEERLEQEQLDAQEQQQSQEESADVDDAENNEPAETTDDEDVVIQEQLLFTEKQILPEATDQSQLVARTKEESNITGKLQKKPVAGLPANLSQEKGDNESV